MAEDADLRQARVLAGLLQATIADLSQRLEAPATPPRRARSLRRAHPRQPVNSLRHEFHEAHRLLDGLYRRYPEMVAGLRPPREGVDTDRAHQPPRHPRPSP
ncbi:hypothetical protein [Mycobacterium paragordonae]|uniref:Uncharacterized protein n=1 Tax=Mycobacterium paragordonae TaxID=1389713 RepID=A0AAJ1W720_9MYCO|nr:hypothetical protein [Mycobacterium paragordonae]MDP7739311.1 hypothetical protein [Mycobacterium paragordonae]TDK94627.1 hypothetical protein EI067_18445 [Mycobacterium paragordonae]TDL04082.1 hypothetical protein EUA05_22820 [Mycobacterium paragordonae]